jgi:hypothetical protein
MLARRTFIVRVYAGEREPIVEDVDSGESVRAPDLDSIGAEIERRLDQPGSDVPNAAADRVRKAP